MTPDDDVLDCPTCETAYDVTAQHRCVPVSSLEPDEYEGLCPCTEGEEYVDLDCTRCGGTGVLYAEEHPSWCPKCGLLGKCRVCDPDRDRD